MYFYLIMTKPLEKIKPNIILLILLLSTILVLPLIPALYQKNLYSFSFIGIFLFASISLKKNHRQLLIGTVILAVLISISDLVTAKDFDLVQRILEIAFIFILVIGFIIRLASKSAVNLSVFVDAIAGYLLLGFAYSLMVTSLIIHYPGSYNISYPSAELMKPYQLYRIANYYTFMTYTTTGYGDVIPLRPIAQSLAILISVAGQLYVATIISLLISKYLSAKQTATD